MTDLRQAAQAVVERWDTPAWEWRDQGPTADLMADLRTALAQPEFYQPAANEAVEILKSLGYVYEPTYTGLAWVTKKSAQPEQEPVADGNKVICPACCHQFRAIPTAVQTLMLNAGFEPPFVTTPAAQRPWQGMTPKEILDLFDRNNVYGSKWIEFARAVEAKLKERNGY